MPPFPESGSSGRTMNVGCSLWKRGATINISSNNWLLSSFFNAPQHQGQEALMLVCSSLTTIDHPLPNVFPSHTHFDCNSGVLDSINDMGLVVQEKAEERGFDGLFLMKSIHKCEGKEPYGAQTGKALWPWFHFPGKFRKQRIRRRNSWSQISDMFYTLWPSLTSTGCYIWNHCIALIFKKYIL